MYRSINAQYVYIWKKGTCIRDVYRYTWSDNECIDTQNWYKVLKPVSKRVMKKNTWQLGGHVTSST